MEIRDLYDENKVLTGQTVLKNERYSSNRKILVVIIFIQNDKGEFLMQKRSIEKDGLWGTTGGHPTSGQTSLEGIITEVKEELGIDISSDDVIFFDTTSNEKVFCDMYYLNKNIDVNTLTLQKEEVETVNWLSLEEIRKIVENNEFKESHLMHLKKCLKYLNIDFEF